MTKRSHSTKIENLLFTPPKDVVELAAIVVAAVDIPIFDQHVVRHMNLLKGNFNQICKTSVEWSDYEEYHDFYYRICDDNSFSTFDQLRLLDKALWGFGRNTKELCNKPKIVYLWE